MKNKQLLSNSAAIDLKLLELQMGQGRGQCFPPHFSLSISMSYSANLDSLKLVVMLVVGGMELCAMLMT